VLEVKMEHDPVFVQRLNQVIGFADDKDIYFMDEGTFLRRFEYKR
jgi:hypothetical protein